MFYTLNILTERVRKDLSGGEIPNDSPYDPDFVMLHVVDAMNEDLKREFVDRRSGNSDDKSPISQCIYTYANIDVLIDSVTKRAYSELPSYFQSLKYNKGIHSVSKNEGSLQPWIRVANPGVTSHLPHANYETWEQVAYYLEGMRVFYMRDIKRDGITKAMIKLRVAVPSTWDPNATLPLIPENVARILDVVKARVLNKIPQDRIADEDPNLRATNESRK